MYPYCNHTVNMGKEGPGFLFSPPDTTAMALSTLLKMLQCLSVFFSCVVGQLPRCKVSSNPESMDECINVISKIRSETKPLPLKGSKHRVQRLLPQFHTPGYLYQEPPCPPPLERPRCASQGGSPPLAAQLPFLLATFCPRDRP